MISLTQTQYDRENVQHAVREADRHPPLSPKGREATARLGRALAAAYERGTLAFGCAQGWVISDGQDARWRAIGDFGLVVWTDKLEEALHFARREDAERFAKEDEDAWLIKPVPITPAHPVR